MNFEIIKSEPILHFTVHHTIVTFAFFGTGAIRSSLSRANSQLASLTMFMELMTNQDYPIHDFFLKET